MNILFYLVPKEDVVFVHDDDTVADAMKTMEKYRFTSVPVLAEDGTYVGSITEGDILFGLRDLGALSVSRMEVILVRQLPRQRDNEPVNINCTMEQLIQTAMKQNFIPVIDDGRVFIGIVTRKSIISYCLEHRSD